MLFRSGLRRKGFAFQGKSALIVGTGGVGSAIAASLATTGLASLDLFDLNSRSAQALAERLQAQVPGLSVRLGRNDPQGYDLVINATPLGMNPQDPAPLQLETLSPSTWVAEVVMSQLPTPLMARARRLGCPLLVGTDMLFEQIPAYLEFFDLPTTTAEHLRELAQIDGISRSLA